MGEIKSYFFDTYALYEILEGNQSYEKYIKEISIITTKLNLMELHYGLLRLHGREKADKTYDRFLEFCIDFDDDSIKESNEFRFLNKKKKLSYVDCIGYIISKKLGVKFLTGDKEFEGFDNVEFVK